jgi:hypothetical protein
MADHERVTGTGLGLAIARDLARAMDGDLDVASLAGTGSAFVLVLPGPAGAHDPDALAAVLAGAITFESDRLDALAAVRAAERDHPSPNARRAVGGLESISTLSAGGRR